MDYIDEIVISSFKEVVEESGAKIEHISLATEASREYGLDSLGIVNCVLAIEDKLDIELDGVLAQIREAKTLGDISNIIRTIKINK